MIDKEKPMKKKLSDILLLFGFLVGLSLLLYPTVSDYWNSIHQSNMIADYSEDVAQLDEESYEDVWNQALEYNKAFSKREFDLQLTDEEREVYEEELNISGNGIMGYVEIPSLDVSLPIYHGTEEGTLQIAVGHIEGSSLPVGGESTHCVLSGHRGLPTSRLFTDLDQLVIGDYFMLQVLDETLTYEVDQILIVDPNELDALEIEEGQDYCTLVTCTPYGVNTQRLLVRGHRVENINTDSQVRVTADATLTSPVLVAPFLAAPVLLLLLILLLIKAGKH
jgi:sortase A